MLERMLCAPMKEQPEMSESESPARARWTSMVKDAGLRMVRALREEVELLDPRRVAAEAMSVALPALTFARTRTMALRAGGFRLGVRTLVLGSLKITGSGNHRALFSVG